ncbi:MAG: hypothetical protein FWH04_00345 [Oscillospiraceae bacterium]|nr:hypothetical protein [Oscillospiraceae bacterium]
MKFRNRKALLIALSLVLAASVAYAAAAGVLTIGGTGTLGDVVNLEFISTSGNTSVVAGDIDTKDVVLDPSQIVMDGNTMTISDINFSDIDVAEATNPGDDAPYFTVDFRVINVGSTNASILAPVNELVLTLEDGTTFTYDGTDTVSSNPIFNDAGNEIKLDDYIDFIGNWNAINGASVAAGTVVPSGTGVYQFGMELSEEAETNFAADTAGKGLAKTLAAATFTFTSVADCAKA